MRRNRILDRGHSPALLAAGLLALSLGLACGGDETPAGGESAAAKIDIPAVAEPQEPVPAQIDDAKLPDDYPKDLPTFPGAKPTVSMLVPGGSGMILLSADSPVDDVTAFYARALPEQGWNVDKSADDGKHLEVSKDARTATVTIEESAEGAQIAVLLGGA